MEDVRRIKVLSKHVENSQSDEHVLIIVMELPLTKDGGFRMRRDDFMTEFYEAIKLYEDKNGTDHSAGPGVAPIRKLGETSLEEGSRGTGFSQRSGGDGS